MAKFVIKVLEGVAAIYPYGQATDVTEVLHAGDSLDCEVPVAGVHAEPQQGGTLHAKAKDDTLVPAAGVDPDSPFGKRSGTLEVEVTQGTVRVRTYESADFSEENVTAGHAVTREVTETNAITLAVYDLVATPKAR